MNCNLKPEQWETNLTIITSILAIITTAIIPLLRRCYQRIKLGINATIILHDGDYYLKLENNKGYVISNIEIEFKDDYLQRLRSIAGDLEDNKYVIELFENIKTIQNKKYTLAAGEIREISLTPFVNIYECRGLLGSSESTLFCKCKERIELYLAKSEVESSLSFSKTIIIKNAK